MSKKRLFILIIAMVVILLSGVIVFMKMVQKTIVIPSTKQAQLSWEECIKLPGSAITQSYPGMCIMTDGRRVIQPIPTSAPSDQKSNIFIQRVGSSPWLGDKPGIEIMVSTSRGFPVRNEMAVLRIGDKEFTSSRYPPGGDIRTLIFSLTPEEFSQTKNGDPVTVYYGQGARSGEQWSFGLLDKNSLDSKSQTDTTRK